MLYRLYGVNEKNKITCYFTAYPEIDTYFWLKRNLHITWLSNPLPFGKLFPLYKDITEGLIYDTGTFHSLKKIIGLVTSDNIIESCRSKFGKVIPPEINKTRISSSDEKDKEILLKILKGRILFTEEIIRALKEHQVKPILKIEHILQLLYLEGKLDLVPAVTYIDGKQKCYRCGETKEIFKVKCAACGDEDCMYCDTCVSMGQARLCKVLFAAKSEQELKKQNITLKLDFALTKPQYDAYKKASEFVKSKFVKGIIWAVCGAGKTEVAFGAIKESLEQGGKVLYAIPRKDTVKDLEPRIRNAFPQSKVVVLYGGSTTKFQQGDIVLATTHQCLRLYREYALVILDEADAFPYEGSEMLYLAVERARKDTGKILYLTATPTKKMLDWSKNGQTQTITVPARHHGFPLPEPVIILNKAPLSMIVDLIIESVYKDKAQVFVFVPTVAMAKSTAEDIGKLLGEKSHIRITYSHSKDVDRDVKRELFSSKKIDVFVTTSIMERGITVARANVIVLFADFISIYSWRTLIQMAGRSGRKSEYPLGKVWFLAKEKTSEMQEASRIIKNMNKEAKSKGYLIN